MVNRFSDLRLVIGRITVSRLGQRVEEVLCGLWMHKDERQLSDDITSEWTETQLDLYFVMDDDAQVFFLCWIRDSKRESGRKECRERESLG